MIKRWTVGGALVVGLLVGLALGRGLFAQQAGITRTHLQTTDIPGSATHEAIMSIVEIPPGASSGKHRHPGIEIGYVLEGSVVLEYEGRPTLTLTAGQWFKNEGAHNGTNRGTRPVKILGVYMVEKGKPLSEPVPQG